MKTYEMPVWIELIKTLILVIVSALLMIYAIENKKLKDGYYIETLVQAQKVTNYDSGRVYWKVIIYGSQNGIAVKPVYTECDSERQVEELKAFYEVAK